MLRTASATIALLALINPALAAGCATPDEAAALKTAVIQQELMVAALQCHETKAYNRFVMSYRDELQSSDASLKTFFIRRGGEAGYDTFKTKAANLSALEQARNAPAFCADAHALYAAAFAHQGSLMSFVEAHAGSADIGGICAQSRPLLTRSDTKPAAKIAEIGVPAHSLPAIPYRRQDIAPPRRAEEREDADDDVAYAEEDAPPPPRYSEVRQRDDYVGRSYAPPAYGPPPRWQRDWRDYPPPPRYGWYERDRDDRW